MIILEAIETTSTEIKYSQNLSNEDLNLDHIAMVNSQNSNTNICIGSSILLLV
jgi:hypothetical protein